MTGAFLYYLFCTTRNRVLSRLRRLRHPKYFLSALAGAAYVYFFLVRNQTARFGSQAAPGPGVVLVMEALFATLLLILSLAPWILPTLGKAPLFAEAEVQFLFPAPLKRRSVLNFRILRMQVGVVVGGAVFALIFGQSRLVSNWTYLFATLWIIYTWVGLYRLGVTLSKASLTRHGVPALRWQACVLGLLALFVVSTVAWSKWLAPSVSEPAVGSLSDLARYLHDLTASGPVLLLLFPFRSLVRPAFAPDLAAFAVRLVPALLILLITYLWVLRADSGSEEVTLEQSEKSARAQERVGVAASGAVEAGRARRVPFELAPSGPAWTAVFWKNLIASGRFGSRQLLMVLGSVVAAIAVLVAATGSAGAARLEAAGTMALMFAGIFTIMGPMILRNDLRLDLLQLDLVKTYPVAGWSLVLGEILAPAAMLACLQWVLLLVGAATLPSLSKWHMTPVERAALTVAAALLLPCYGLIGILLQNAAALLLPSWVQLGWKEKQGIEAMGQRLIQMSATLLAFALAALPAGIAFALLYLPGRWILGQGAIALGAAAAAAVLLAEAGIAIAWMGSLFERLDLSSENLAS